MRDPFLRWVEVVGTLEPDEEVTVYAQVSGYVEKILVDLGDRVKEGGAVSAVPTICAQMVRPGKAIVLSSAPVGEQPRQVGTVKARP